MDAYRHIVQYYETDKMGITHHSNYIRWMEEARIDFLKQIGWPYDKLEQQGIISPVVGVTCQYRKTTTFAETIVIHVTVQELKAAKLTLNYEMKNDKGEVVCEGTSSHCFISTTGRLIRLAKEHPEFYAVLNDLTK